MFGFLNKKNRIKEDDYRFLKAVTKQLLSSYPYLLNQVSKDFILDKKRNDLGDKGTYTLTLNASLENKYFNKSLPQFFIIKNIEVWNKSKKSFEEIELHILEGMLAGFRIVSDYGDLDLDKINTSKVIEKNFKNDDKEQLENILSINQESKLRDLLDIESTFKIEIEEGEFYVIKDLGNGNYLAVDKKGSIYGMIHDPYEVEKIYDNKEVFFS